MKNYSPSKLFSGQELCPCSSADMDDVGLDIVPAFGTLNDKSQFRRMVRARQIFPTSSRLFKLYCLQYLSDQWYWCSIVHRAFLNMRFTSPIFTSLAIGWTGGVLAQNTSFSNATSNEEVDQNYFLLNSPFGILKNNLAAQVLELPTGTCSAETPCINGACCSIVCDYVLDSANITDSI